MIRSRESKNPTDVVRTIFPNAVSLFDYCTSIIELSKFKVDLISPDDSPAYKDMLHSSLIVPPAPSEQAKLVFSFNGTNKFPMKDVLSRLVGQLVHSGQPYHEQNCLCLGHRPKNVGSDATMRSSHDTDCFFVNSIHPIITTVSWQQLLNRIGI